MAGPCGVFAFIAERFVTESKGEVYEILHNHRQTYPDSTKKNLKLIYTSPVHTTNSITLKLNFDTGYLCYDYAVCQFFAMGLDLLYTIFCSEIVVNTMHF